MYWSLDHSVPGMSKKSNLINKIICCVQEGYSIHRKIFSPNCVKKVMKNPTKFKIEKFLSRAIIWLNLIKMSSIDMFSHISMHIWWVFEEKIENFSFSFFFAFCHFLGFWQYVTYDYQIWENSWFFGPNGFWQFH